MLGPANRMGFVVRHQPVRTGERVKLPWATGFRRATSGQDYVPQGCMISDLRMQCSQPWLILSRESYAVTWQSVQPSTDERQAVPDLMMKVGV